MKSLSLLALILCVSCGAAPKGPVITSLAFESADINDGGLVIIKDRGVLLTVKATGADGGTLEPDADAIIWGAKDPTVATVTPLGTTVIVKGHKDWFDVLDGGFVDQGSEPSTTITVSTGDVTVTIGVSVVPDMQGNWHIVVDGASGYDLDGLTQHGRTVENKDLGVAGFVSGRDFDFNALGYKLHGQFGSRNYLSGTYTATSGTGAGSWAAVKKP